MTKPRKRTALVLIAALAIFGTAFAGPVHADPTDPGGGGGGSSCWMTGYAYLKPIHWSSCPAPEQTLVLIMSEECCYNPWYYTVQCSFKQTGSYCL